MKEGNYNYDAVIIGAGVSGAAQAYIFSKYTKCKKVAIFEKETKAGGINSSKINNSQTLHEGDIETNYNYEKAEGVKHKAYFTRKYVTSKGEDSDLFLRGGRMVLGVGDDEVRVVEKRYEEFKNLFDGLKLLKKGDIKEVEPKIVEGRDPNENIAAIYRKDGLTIDYGLMAEELLKDAQEANEDLEIFNNQKILEIKRIGKGGFFIDTDRGYYTTRFLSICAGSHSMYFAKKLNIPSVKYKSLLCVAGNFYYTKKLLNNKVYTVQDPLLPFSAVHGDPDIIDKTKTRYGPTTRIVFQLERRNYTTVFEFFKTLSPALGTLKKYIKIMSNKKFFFYALKQNIAFQIPIIGNYLFAKEAQKIIPSITRKDIEYAKNQGGVRPQIIDTKADNLFNLGEAKLEDENILINVTPSPGATTSIYNAIIDVRKIATTINCDFLEKELLNDFGVDKV